uniref:UAA transporter n=1 Tax=Syphacia muris TaxID=451379 RepID=A0A0N5AP16_9BILA
MSTAGCVAVAGTLGGCIGSMYFVESIATEHPGAMNLLTFSTFLFISLEGLIFITKFFTVPNRIPLRGYLPTMIMFFFVNVVNNQALNFHVPVPLHIIFRSGSLLASLLMTKLLQRKQYSLRKYVSVIMITIGIVLCTLATSKLQKSDWISSDEAFKHYKEWLIGITMLIVALIASAYLAICQEQMYRTYGKHTREAMFYVHAISLPFFSLMSSDIIKYIRIFSASSPVHFLTFEIPHMWILLIAACFLQWVCIRFVYLMNAELESLTVTLVVTLRKFLSLIISIVWFKNPFTLTHWFGAFFVFSGTLLFADIWSRKVVKKKAD